ncbi:NAD-dependent deacetylase [Kineosphaera limosa]|uniref:protein acetyllysine N-acetyltransferase n=1 Tax=Kineosphaera limosa NBRC 100340 TaxID=1184609 RepID=K6XHF6_9MICO|nr:Sir2 family NAD-dependent protein deacetylase [Kineosphaera limosa]NYE01595.1 NAD-dependent deacetylase [Kineosphaera limosa]GAB98269.1 NAD-dependent deacetylase [Kineosphaera limosa NBRC 100340]
MREPTHVDLADIAPRGRFHNVVALTGAGISAAAGLGTFRGAGGLWTAQPDVEAAMHAHELPGNVPALWDVWGGIRRRALMAGPSAAHQVLAELGVRVITQNIDGLHQDAGSTDVLELHGSAGRAACLNPACGYRGRSDLAGPPPPPGHVPPCPACGGQLRPDVVLFGETLDPHTWQAAQEAVEHADLMLAIGTSAFVTPAIWLVPMARDHGALCVNLNVDDSLPRLDPFHAHVIGDCQETLPRWLEQR